MTALSEVPGRSEHRGLRQLAEKLRAHPRLLLLLGLLAIGLVSFGVLMWSTGSYGIGTTSDSVAYVRSARTLARGIGLGRITPDGDFRALVDFPPLFPVTLAIFELVGIDALAAARFQVAILYAATIFFAGLVVQRMTFSFWLSILTAGFLAISAPMVRLHLWAMSDPLYAALSLFILLLVDRHLAQEKRSSLVVISILLGLAFMARNAGFSLIAAAAIVVLLEQRLQLQKRLRKAALVLSISALPMGLWLIRNQVTSGTALNRRVTFHGLGIERVTMLTDTLSSWLEPLQSVGPLNYLSLGAAALALVVFFFSQQPAASKEQAREMSRLPRLLLAYFFTYSIVLFGSASVLDAMIPLDNRLMFPLFATSVLLLAFLFSRLWQALTDLPLARALSLALGVAVYTTFVVGYGTQSKAELSLLRNVGLGYSNQALANSAIIRDLRALPDGLPIYTDNLETVYFFTERTAYRFPIRFDSVTQLERIDYEAQLKRVQTQAGDAGAAFVFFEPRQGIEDLIASRFADAELMCDCNGGLIYLYEGGQS